MQPGRDQNTSNDNLFLISAILKSGKMGEVLRVKRPERKMSCYCRAQLPLEDEHLGVGEVLPTALCKNGTMYKTNIKLRKLTNSLEFSGQQKIVLRKFGTQAKYPAHAHN